MAPPTSGPAPDDGLPLGHEELDRDHLDAVALERRDLVVRAGLGLALDAHHQRHVGPGDVRIEQADRCAGLRERNGQVDGDRALPHAALARGDRDRVLDAGEQLLRLGRAGPPDHRPPRHVDELGSEALEHSLDVAVDLVLERAGRRRQLDRQADPRPVDLDVLDHVERDDVAPELGLLDGAQRVEDRASRKSGSCGGSSLGLPATCGTSRVEILPRLEVTGVGRPRLRFPRPRRDLEDVVEVAVSAGEDRHERRRSVHRQEQRPEAAPLADVLQLVPDRSGRAAAPWRGCSGQASARRASGGPGRGTGRPADPRPAAPVGRPAEAPRGTAAGRRRAA